MLRSVKSWDEKEIFARDFERDFERDFWRWYCCESCSASYFFETCYYVCCWFVSYHVKCCGWMSEKKNFVRNRGKKKKLFFLL